MASVLVDTSVWVDFFRGRLAPDVYAQLAEGIRLRTAAITDIIRHEIVVGARDHQQMATLRRLLVPLPCLRVADEDLEALEEFAWDVRRKGLQGKYTDVTIAFLCVRHRLPLMAVDDYFAQLARKGILHLL